MIKVCVFAKRFDLRYVLRDLVPELWHASVELFQSMDLELVVVFLKQRQQRRCTGDRCSGHSSRLSTPRARSPHDLLLCLLTFRALRARQNHPPTRYRRLQHGHSLIQPQRCLSNVSVAHSQGLVRPDSSKLGHGLSRLLECVTRARCCFSRPQQAQGPEPADNDTLSSWQLQLLLWLRTRGPRGRVVQQVSAQRTALWVASQT